MANNVVSRTDSYKFSHPMQYPKDVTGMFDYIESRGGDYEFSVFFGLQGFLKQYLTGQRLTQEMIDREARKAKAHGVPFHREGWEHILKTYDGKIPVTIKAVPEGSIIPTHNALVTIECNDPKAYWVVSHLETSLLRGVWYPTTIATRTWYEKQALWAYLKLSSDDPEGQLPFKNHDFGARGVSSAESAEIGGAAHLVNFLGSDTFESLDWIWENYGEEMAGFSLPAAEHSTMSARGRNGEWECMQQMLTEFGGEYPVIACVSDTYDIFNACRNIWGNKLKAQVLESGSTVVIRPDSGDPTWVPVRCMEILDEAFGGEVNHKGYRVLNNVRVIQGDGMDPDSITELCRNVVSDGYSMDNLVTGEGGAKLQKINRDTMKWANKCSAMEKDGEWVDIYKDPVTDSGKTSKRGRVMLVIDPTYGGYRTIREGEFDSYNQISAMHTVFDHGELRNEQTFAQIRERANSHRLIYWVTSDNRIINPKFARHGDQQ